MPLGTCELALVESYLRADNGMVNRLRPLLRNDIVLPLFVTFGVVVAATADWLAGQPPQSRIPSVSGFGPFLAAALFCMVAAVLAGDVRRSSHWRSASLGAAIVGAALADPTYATLLAAVPLIEIARRAHEPERTVSITVAGVALAWLAVTEESAQQAAAFESILVLAIVMTIIVMFGGALRRGDQTSILEARLARVDERANLARDIHDSLGHNLLASSIQLRNAEALLDQDLEAARNSMDLAALAISEALAETRLMVDGTRAEGGSFSLERSLPGLVSRITTPQVPVTLEMVGDHGGLDSMEQITLYRFAQEALANVIRHADATSATVKSSVIQGIASVTVVDNGRGFDVASALERTGLATLRERLGRHGGSVRVTSDQGSGTTVTAVLEVTS